MEILKFYHKEQRLIKCYMRKHLILLKVRNMVDINVNLHHLFIDFVIKSLLLLICTQRQDLIMETNNKQKNYTNQLLQKLRSVKYIFPLRTTFGGVDLVDMLLKSKYNKEIWFLLLIIDIVSKSPWVVPLKDNYGITIANLFQKILDESRNLN